MGIESRRPIRINIGPMARILKESGPQIQQDDPFNKAYEKGGSEANDLWNQSKTERNALSAVLIDHVINQAISNRTLHPPYGLMNAEGKTVKDLKSEKDPFNTLSEHMRATMRKALDEKIKEWEKFSRVSESNGESVRPFFSRLIRRKIKAEETTMQEHPPESIIQTYKRLKMISDFKNKYINIQKYDDKETVELAIQRGIGTSAEQMAALLELIPNVYNQEYPDQHADAAALIAIARNSYHFIVGLASDHVEIFSEKKDILGTGGGSFFFSNKYRFKPDYFTIIQTPKGPTIALKESVRRFLKEFHDSLPKDYAGSPDETRCPALIDFSPNGKSGGSAIKKLWDWHVELGEEIYKGIYQTKAES